MERIYITARYGIVGDGEKVLSPIYVGVEGDEIVYVSDKCPEDATTPAIWVSPP